MPFINRTVTIGLLCVIALSIFLYLTMHVLTPFIIALTLAYFLAPVVKKMQKYKIPRLYSVIIVMIAIVIIFVLFSLILIPLFYKQISWVINAVVNHKNDISIMTNSIVEHYHVNPTLIKAFKSSFNDISSSILTYFGNFITSLFQTGINAINIVTTIFITPIVLYYFLIDWPKIVSTIDSLIPRKMFKRYNIIKKDIDITLSNFIRGQASVCFIMGLYYIVTLNLAGSESGLALGIISGLLSFIPYAGCLFSAFLSCFMIAVQYEELSRVIIVVAVYCVGQFIEGNFIVPKVIGSKLQLHPVWIIFGLLTGGALFGFVGVLIALPLTAVIAVFIRCFHNDYKNSLIYSA